MNELSLFDTFFGNPRFNLAAMNTKCVPNVDVEETKDSYVLYMDLPGRTEKDVEVSLKNGVLTIASTEKEEKEETSKDTTWLLKERTTSEFKRSFTLPKDINEEKVDATFKNGVLSISIGRKAEPEEKKISIVAA